MSRFVAPANVLLRRAQVTLLLATLVPTVLMTGVGIVLVAVGDGIPATVSGVLVLAFCTSSVAGYIVGSIFVRRGASLARFQNDFLSSVSHELRTPLTSIGMFIDTLRDDRLTDPAEKNKCYELLEQEIGRLRGLVERLLSLSRIESGRHDFERRLVDVGTLVQNSIEAFEAASIHDRTAVEVNIDGGEVMGDASALQTAVTNLLINAWKYTPTENRTIAINSERRGRWLELTVVDNGPGISRDEQKHIFDHFERGKAANRGQQGSGLGLAIVRAIVRAHGGRIDVRSGPGRGAEFRIRLKLAQQ